MKKRRKLGQKVDITHRLMVVKPLFKVKGQGLIPHSPKQFELIQIPEKIFKTLNNHWHSRLPLSGSFYINSMFFALVYKNIYFAVAGWSYPIARAIAEKGILELRRMAIAPTAPRNTASRMIKLMTQEIKKAKPNVWKLISYQDTEVHHGTIYKASNWEAVYTSGGHSSWDTHTKRRAPTQTHSLILGQKNSIKVRWEWQIKPKPHERPKLKRRNK